MSWIGCSVHRDCFKQCPSVGKTVCYLLRLSLISELKRFGIGDVEPTIKERVGCSVRYISYPHKSTIARIGVADNYEPVRCSQDVGRLTDTVPVNLVTCVPIKLRYFIRWVESSDQVHISVIAKPWRKVVSCNCDCVEQGASVGSDSPSLRHCRNALFDREGYWETR